MLKSIVYQHLTGNMRWRLKHLKWILHKLIDSQKNHEALENNWPFGDFAVHQPSRVAIHCHSRWVLVLLAYWVEAPMASRRRWAKHKDEMLNWLEQNDSDNCVEHKRIPSN
jgi:hypothetical protein